MADDSTQSVADSQASFDPNIIPTPESASSPADRPVSTILADSPIEPKTPLADPPTDYTIPSPVPDESTAATESASLTPSPSTVSADSEGQTPANSQTTVPSESSVATQSATVPTETQGEASPSPVPEEIQATPPQTVPQVTPTQPSEPTEGGSIQDSSPFDKPSQVQPEVSVNAPSPLASQAKEISPQSAEIKPEPLEGTQEAPLADSDSQKSSYGDLTDITNPSSPVPSVEPTQPSVPSSSIPKTSFGDFIEKPPTDVPTITIEPIEPPKPTQQPQPPPSPQSPLPAEASAKEGISPTSPQPPTETVVEAKADFSTKRQQALQTRRKKREDYLAKILTLVSQKGKIHNKDICNLLRVSQSTATNYLQTLIKDGKIKKEGKAKATIYSL